MKPKQLSIENKNYFAWEYEEQTQVKHTLLQLYYKVYASKLGSKSNTLFVDCHGGCGAYIDANNIVCYGSAVLVNDVCLLVYEARKTKNLIIVCEKDKTNYDNLNKVICDLNIKHIKVFNDDYNTVLKNDKIKSYYSTYPTLFFIDPFGYYDTPMCNMAELLKTFGNEILVNFMFDFLNRGIGVSAIDEQQLTNFFGSDEWKQAKVKTGIERESFLVNLYKNNLKRITNAKYVFSYRLCYPDRKQTYYYLIHATNHIDGISLMKDCFASFNNGRVEYLGKQQNAISLFDLDYYKQTEISTLLFEKYRNRTISFKALLEENIEDTAILEKDLRATIKALEEQNKVKINRIDSKRSGIKGRDEVVFGG